jgi:hypothetical protein
MPPALVAMLLIVMLAALIPVRRLSLAGWSTGTLFTTWVLYSVGLFVGLRFPGVSRFVLPVLLVAFVLPFVAGPERLTRLFGRRRPPVINVTPPPRPGLAEPAPAPMPKPSAGEEAAGDAAAASSGASSARPSQRWVPGRPGRTRRPPEEER